jgi:Bax protein
MFPTKLHLADIRLAGRAQWLPWLGLLIAGLGLVWLVLHVVTTIPDFRDFPAGPERKSAFFAFMLPLIEQENDRVQKVREQLLAIAADDDGPGWLERRWLRRIAVQYGLEPPIVIDIPLMGQLLRRVDSVPVSLALAQAAKESGWGSSRFARKGNNLFGQWCFETGCGLVPSSRAAGATHEVETFFSPRQSVAAYLHNINSHTKYRAFRAERARLRRNNRNLSGLLLAETMSQYSQRRDAYVLEIKQLIRTNDLHILDGATQ